MQLEPGKYYRTRDGNKAWVGVVGNPLSADAEEQAIGWSDGAILCWTREGRYYSYRSDSDADLIAEWTDDPAPQPTGDYAVIGGKRYRLVEDVG